MANPEHVAILGRGVDSWNEWRRENPKITPDLKKANLNEANLNEANLDGANLNEAKLMGAKLKWAYLRKADLSKANFIWANLHCAKLSQTDLSQTNLSQARLIKADLSKANLDGANLTWVNIAEANLNEANLTRANLAMALLVKANLSGANLTEANFMGAGLDWANLDGAVFSSTVFGAIDLSTVSGLESAKHNGPSTIGIDTFFRSKGKIPESFLRGAGVPDIFIQYAASLSGAALEFYSAFISYSSKDAELAQRLYADLQANGVRCWFAPEDLKIGDRFRVELDRAIRIHDKLLLLLSANSVLSDWVEKEVEAAFERERRDKRTILFPVRLDDAIMTAEEGWAADIRRARHIGDFTKWKDHEAYQKAFDRLLRDLKAAKAPPPTMAKA